MTDTSANLNLPFIQPAQAQKHVTHNEALERLDVVAQLAVQEFEAVLPPEVPSDGQAFALGPAPLGAWSGNGSMIAAYQNGGWVFISPRNGWIAANTMGQLKVFTSSGWQSLTLGDGAHVADNLGIGTSADQNNRLSVASSASLFTHVGSDHRLTINKANDAATSSVVFQNNWSGRAEFGLNGDDRLSLKTSVDGNTWATAIAFDAGNETATLGHVLRLAPRSEPAGSAGAIYFDALTNKLRCHDGSVWHDLF